MTVSNITARPNMPSSECSSPTAEVGIIFLPDEILLMAFKYLEDSDLTSSLKVCKRWHRLIDENSFEAKSIRWLPENVQNTILKELPMEDLVNFVEAVPSMQKVAAEVLIAAQPRFETIEERGRGFNEIMKWCSFFAYIGSLEATFGYIDAQVGPESRDVMYVVTSEYLKEKGEFVKAYKTILKIQDINQRSERLGMLCEHLPPEAIVHVSKKISRTGILDSKDYALILAFEKFLIEGRFDKCIEAINQVSEEPNSLLLKRDLFFSFCDAAEKFNEIEDTDTLLKYVSLIKHEGFRNQLLEQIGVQANQKGLHDRVGRVRDAFPKDCVYRVILDSKLS